MDKIIDGKKIAKEIKDELKEKVKKLKETGVTPCLAVIQVGSVSESTLYVNNKKRACEYIRIKSISKNLDESTTQEELLELIEELNNDNSVHGILVQLPLPSHIDENAVIHAIHPSKDVDGFHPETVGNMFIEKPGYLPCTPAGIIELLKRSGIKIEGKHAVIVGRSNIVGKPAGMLMLQENATVTIAHSKTENLKEVCKTADILIVAVGKEKFITSEYIKEGAVVIDVGIHYHNDGGKPCGDVDFDNVYPHVSAITPVPGGVGPMTVAMLMKNCVNGCKN